MYDFVVVGGGPTGLLCASRCELDGIVLEEHKDIGNPVNCSGLLSISGLEKLGVRGDFVLNKVRGAVFHVGKEEAIIESESDVAFVVDRASFDKEIARKCKKEILRGVRCKGILRNKGNFTVKIDNDEFDAKSVVIASGTDTQLHKDVSLSAPRDFIKTVQYEISGLFDAKFVHLYLDAAPGFFGWIIPVNKELARVGLGTFEDEKTPAYRQEKFLSKLEEGGILDKGFDVRSKSGGLIPLYDPAISWENEGAYLLGDAATQVKATSGGGVIIGGLCAMKLAECLERGNSYEVATRKLKSELRLHLLLRKFINKLEPKTIVGFLKSERVKRVIVREGDMDMASELMSGFLKSPTAFVQALPLLMDFIF